MCQLLLFDWKIYQSDQNDLHIYVAKVSTRKKGILSFPIAAIMFYGINCSVINMKLTDIQVSEYGLFEKKIFYLNVN